MTKAQIIRDDIGSPAFAVVPWREHERSTAAGTDARLSAPRSAALNSL